MEGTGAPTGTGYTKIYSNKHAFAALNADGSITSWGSAGWGGSGAPTGSGYTQIYSTSGAFAALNADGSISAWGMSFYGGTGAPTDTGYTQIYSTIGAFAALKADGSITSWGRAEHGGSDAPTDTGYTKIYSTSQAFAALNADGSITTWGDAQRGGSGVPTDSGYTEIYANWGAFAALKADGSITTWGHAGSGGTGAPTDSGYTKIYSNEYAFAALKEDGSITSWGDADLGGSGAPTDSGYTEIYSTHVAFAALKADGSITSWSNRYSGVSGAPTDTGYVKIYSTSNAFAALKENGSITSWGDASSGGTGAPTDTGYTKIYSTIRAFAALKEDGSITTWGDANWGGSGAPTTTANVAISTQEYVGIGTSNPSTQLEVAGQLTISDGTQGVGKVLTSDANGRASWQDIPEGIDGADGKDGKDGKSAYEIAVEQGYSGTKEEWIASLQGDPGIQGIPGTDGADGKDGADGTDGQDGDNYFVELGNTVMLSERNLVVDEGNIRTTGYVGLGSADNVCNTQSEGAIKYNNTAKSLVFCDGSAWQEVNTANNEKAQQFDAVFSIQRIQPLTVIDQASAKANGFILLNGDTLDLTKYSDTQQDTLNTLLTTGGFGEIQTAYIYRNSITVIDASSYFGRVDSSRGLGSLQEDELAYHKHLTGRYTGTGNDDWFAILEDNDNKFTSSDTFRLRGLAGEWGSAPIRGYSLSSSDNVNTSTTLQKKISGETRPKNINIGKYWGLYIGF